MKDMVGKKFTRWKVISKAGLDKSGQYMWLCICECGNTKTIIGSSLRSGNSKSCGCLKAEKLSEKFSLHKMKGSRVYNIWCSMRQRCNYPSHVEYHRYGGRGITVCKRWDEFNLFLSDMGEPPSGCSIDRIDNDKGYSPDNCKWSTRDEQANNRSTNVFVEFDGETLTVANLCKKLGVNRSTFISRARRCGSYESALAKTIQKMVNL